MDIDAEADCSNSVDAKQIYLSNLQEPVVLCNVIVDWESTNWTPDVLGELLANEEINFRIGQQSNDDVQWEGDCKYERATIRQFSDWLKGDCSEDNPLHFYSTDLYWCYADYKYMADVFKDRPDILKCVDWSKFGFPNRDGEQSTFWMGSKGSYTVCHQDTYGYNLFAQIYGRKRWIFYPPDQKQYLYPTRVPYEESSVFSKVSINHPDLKMFPLFQNTTPYIVILEPGDVLVIPHLWWHFVESLENSISINSWIELDVDDEERLKEARTRNLVFKLMNEKPSEMWLNPTEVYTESNENLELLRLSLSKIWKKKCSRELGRKRKSETDLEQCQQKKHKNGDSNEDTLFSTFSSPKFNTSFIKKIKPCEWKEFLQIIDSTSSSVPCIIDSNVEEIRQVTDIDLVDLVVHPDIIDKIFTNIVAKIDKFVTE